MQKNSQNLIWVDLEMTGLVPETDVIIEIATIVTDKDLNTLAEGPVIAIHQPDSVLEQMDEWNTSHHGASGLTKRVKESQVSSADAEKQTIAFLEQYIDKGQSPMCGNSICQDRRFMARLMPELEAFFHYRNFDVSSFKIAANLWAADIANGFEKKGAHLALDDIRESIAEMQYYRSHILKI